MIELGELGARIQTLRRDRGLILQELAAAAAVSASMLSSVERGQKAPTIVVLARIADGLGVPLNELIAGGGSPVIVRRAGQQDVIDEPGGWRREIRQFDLGEVLIIRLRRNLGPAIGDAHCLAKSCEKLLLGKIALPAAGEIEVDEMRASPFDQVSTFFPAAFQPLMPAGMTNTFL